MKHITEEATKLDEYFTNTTQDFQSGKPGFFARQKSMVVVVDEFSARYLTAKAFSSKLTPAELISDMIRRDIAIGQ